MYTTYVVKIYSEKEMFFLFFFSGIFSNIVILRLRGGSGQSNCSFFQVSLLYKLNLFLCPTGNPAPLYLSVYQGHIFLTSRYFYPEKRWLFFFLINFFYFPSIITN